MWLLPQFMYGCFESMDFCVSHTFSSAPLLPLHQRHRRFLWRSCALLSGSDCRRFSECGIVFPKFGIVNVIDKTIQNLAAQESGFAFHAGGFYFLFQYVLLIVT